MSLEQAGPRLNTRTNNAVETMLRLRNVVLPV
jgi:hypothetical protein